ncbi:MAG: GAF domain-containing sensor histidine kinase [Leptolyngbyaceae cyanobacterium CRU_2_3]|nr:GAF domain-containing sensor histidine kinase [Leptolyngbyaceae cyanobacterium CRU_2_3]
MQQKVAQIRPDLEQHLTQAILTSKGSQDALMNLSKIIGETFQAESCLIMPQSRTQATAHSSCWLSTGLQNIYLQDHLKESLAYQVHQADWADGELVIITNLQASDPTHEVNPALQSKVALIVSTQFQGHVNGVVALVQSQPYLWKESDVQLLQSLAPQVAIAISQAQLGHQLQQQARYQALIDQLTAAIRNAWELEEIFKLAVEGTASALEVSQGMLLLFKYADPLHKSRNLEGIPQTTAYVAADWSEHISGKIFGQTHPEAFSTQPASSQKTSFQASNCRICRQVLMGKLDPVIVPVSEMLAASHSEVSHLEAHHPKALDVGQEIAAVFQLQPSHALLLIPLENQGRVLGCLVLQHHQPRLWSTEELSFSKLVAAQLSTAIIQTRTLKQIQSVVQERTAQLERSLEVQAKLYEKSRQQVEQLRRLNEEREEFLSTVSHELRTPLTSMTLAIRMLRQAGLPPERQDKYLTILEQQCAQETNLINDLLALRKLESNQTNSQLQKMDIRYLIQGAAQSVEASWANKSLTLVVDMPNEPVLIYTDPDSLKRVLLELLTNARKYSEPGSTVELKLTREINSSNSQVLLSLRNVGDGILPEELPHIFEKFRRGEGVTQRAIQGTGLGLALVKGLVEHLNGAIAATSQPQPSGSWETCFTLTLDYCPEAMFGALLS